MTTASPDRGRGRALWLILLLALVVRLVVALSPLHELANDETEYLPVARDLLAGRGWVFYETYHWLRAPLYPLFLAGTLWLAGDDLRVALLAQVLVSLVTVWLVHRLAWLVWGRRSVALLAALLWSVLLTLATFTRLVMAETLFSLWLALGLVLVLQAERASGRTRAGWAAAAGLALGLACLTRSLALPLVAVAAAWLALPALRWRPLAPTPGATAILGAALALVLASGATILPWTIRNQLAYGRPILIETGLSFNLWAFSEPRETRAQILAALERIPNPAERADYATARGLAYLRADPSILPRKIYRNWIYLWRVKPIQDRFLLTSYYRDVPFGPFVTALVFDDALYLLIVVSAAAGLVLAPHGRARLLLGGWLVVAVALILLTNGEGRYRHVLYPVLIPYAAWALASVRRPAWSAARSGLAAGLAVLMAGTFLYAYPYDYARDNLTRGWLVFQGDLAGLRGDIAGAAASYRAAGEFARTPDPYLALGALWQAAGRLDDAEAAYVTARGLEIGDVVAAAQLGNLLRSRGDAAGARAAFAGQYIEPQLALDWSWANLDPPPVTRIAIGDGLDYGYVGGMYPDEQLDGVQARWTRAEAWLRLEAPGHGAHALSLRMAGPRPDGSPVVVNVCVPGACVPLPVRPGWQIYTVQLPPGPPGRIITLRSPTFRAADGRDPGVLLDWAAVR